MKSTFTGLHSFDWSHLTSAAFQYNTNTYMTTPTPHAPPSRFFASLSDETERADIPTNHARRYHHPDRCISQQSTHKKQLRQLFVLEFGSPICRRSYSSNAPVRTSNLRPNGFIIFFIFFNIFIFIVFILIKSIEQLFLIFIVVSILIVENFVVILIFVFIYYIFVLFIFVIIHFFIVVNLVFFLHIILFIIIIDIFVIFNVEIVFHILLFIVVINVFVFLLILIFIVVVNFLVFIHILFFIIVFNIVLFFHILLFIIIVNFLLIFDVVLFFHILFFIVVIHLFVIFNVFVVLDVLLFIFVVDIIVIVDIFFIFNVVLFFNILLFVVLFDVIVIFNVVVVIHILLFIVIFNFVVLFHILFFIVIINVLVFIHVLFFIIVFNIVFFFHILFLFVIIDFLIIFNVVLFFHFLLFIVIVDFLIIFNVFVVLDVVFFIVVIDIFVIFNFVVIFHILLFIIVIDFLLIFNVFVVFDILLFIVVIHVFVIFNVVLFFHILFFIVVIHVFVIFNVFVVLDVLLFIVVHPHLSSSSNLRVIIRAPSSPHLIRSSNRQSFQLPSFKSSFLFQHHLFLSQSSTSFVISHVESSSPPRPASLHQRLNVSITNSSNCSLFIHRLQRRHLHPQSSSSSSIITSFFPIFQRSIPLIPLYLNFFPSVNPQSSVINFKRYRRPLTVPPLHRPGASTFFPVIFNTPPSLHLPHSPANHVVIHIFRIILQHHPSFFNIPLLLRHHRTVFRHLQTSYPSHPRSRSSINRLPTFVSSHTPILFFIIVSNSSSYSSTSFLFIANFVDSQLLSHITSPLSCNRLPLSSNTLVLRPSSTLASHVFVTQASLRRPPSSSSYHISGHLNFRRRHFHNPPLNASVTSTFVIHLQTTINPLHYQQKNLVSFFFINNSTSSPILQTVHYVRLFSVTNRLSLSPSSSHILLSSSIHRLHFLISKTLNVFLSSTSSSFASTNPPRFVHLQPSSSSL
ncbi:hypothetical protein BV898_14151 [Hypsibius exemplaris]|uniref:Uncharacterized protein n=1 Tax=Hypsibius exemplaris TaxID=2072580 RepID=A0A1W0W8P4_HYPEX|nr:hypothetical protein BV898_14151 [Hypsibius exemplaris]